MTDRPIPLHRRRGLRLLPPLPAPASSHPAPARPRRLPIRLSLPGPTGQDLNSLAEQTGIDRAELAVLAIGHGLAALRRQRPDTCGGCR